MADKNRIYTLSFGQLTQVRWLKNELLWEGNVQISCPVFTGHIPIYVFSKGEDISPRIIQLVEDVLRNIDTYLYKAVLFINQAFTNNPKKYKIRESEIKYLNYNVESFPLNFPELTFWDYDSKWWIRFAEGKFDICDPLGIGIYFDKGEPTIIENLEDSEFIDE